MSELGIVEDEIFKKRQRTEEMFRARDKAKRKRIRLQQNREHQPTHILSGQYAPMVRWIVMVIHNLLLDWRIFV